MLTCHELFGFMSPALALEILTFAHEEDKALYKGTMAAVAEARKVRPVFLERQPRTQRHANMLASLTRNSLEPVAANLIVSKVDEFLNKEAKGTSVIGAHSIEGMIGLLKKPRRVMLMVKAGKPVDEFIEQLLPHLEAGDIIIDGGNSLFEDTRRRAEYVESKRLLYIGTGVSGGEEGARHGPSITPGGSP